ncbi:DUF932 domain-containing protein [Paenibacillus illinoisensis]|uniref:DUF932 domain-containing protein n=1 Tax=Paenibacillus illinoisensis TaxID=59845 RepID=UPI003016CBE7
MPANVEEMFSVRVAPWHGLGKIVKEAPDSAAAIKLAGLDWDVIQSPVYVDDQKVDNYFANKRSDNNEVLGIVTGRYSIVQNSEAFAFTDSLIKEGEVKYETAGSLKDGRQVWMLAKMEQEYSILGDKFDPYMCFINSHDGTGAVRVLMTPIRVVCQNTLNAALAGAKRAWSTTHVGNMADKLEDAKNTLMYAGHYMNKLEEDAHRLTDIKLTAEKYGEIINEILPITVKTSERQAKVIQLRRDAILHAMKADDIRKFAGTGWGFMNAISDYTTHAEPVRKTETFRDNQFSRVVAGDKLFDLAYTVLNKVA